MIQILTARDFYIVQCHVSKTAVYRGDAEADSVRNIVYVTYYICF